MDLLYWHWLVLGFVLLCAEMLITTEFVLFSALIGQALLGLILAWLSQSVPPALKSALQTAVIAAWILPEVVIGFAWFAFLERDNGTLNMILTSLGLPRGDFLLQQPFIVIVVFNTWRGAAFSMMLFNSAFASIPPSYFQAADVAGATSFQKALGAIHALSHPVGALYDTHHGMTNAVFMPYVLVANRSAIEDKIKRLAAYCGLASDFDAFLREILDLRASLGVPHTLREFRVDSARRGQIADMAVVDPTAGGNPVQVTREFALGIFDRSSEGRL